MSRDERIIEAVISENFGGLPEELRSILIYAKKLTLSPADMTEEDVMLLRSAGHEDVAILQIAQITSYFNFVNRLVEGLGVQLESQS